MQAVLNVSVQQQRARILVPAIVQGLTRRPAASDAGVLHVQGAPAFALSIPQTDMASSQRHGTLHRAARSATLFCYAGASDLLAAAPSGQRPASAGGGGWLGSGSGSPRQRRAMCLQPMSPDGHRPH